MYNSIKSKLGLNAVNDKVSDYWHNHAIAVSKSISLSNMNIRHAIKHSCWVRENDLLGKKT